MRQVLVLAVLMAAATCPAASPQAISPIPRTTDGRPDFGGTWSMSVEIRLEGPDGLASLVLTPEQAAERLAAVLAERARPANLDPDSANPDFAGLMQARRIPQLHHSRTQFRQAAFGGCR